MCLLKYITLEFVSTRMLYFVVGKSHLLSSSSWQSATVMKEKSLGEKKVVGPSDFTSKVMHLHLGTLRNLCFKIQSQITCGLAPHLSQGKHKHWARVIEYQKEDTIYTVVTLFISTKGFSHFFPSHSLFHPTGGERASERAAVWCWAAYWGETTTVLFGTQHGPWRVWDNERFDWNVLDDWIHSCYRCLGISWQAPVLAMGLACLAVC